MTSSASAFEIVLEGNEEGGDGEKREKRRLDFCICFKKERKKYMYVVLTVLSSP